MSDGLSTYFGKCRCCLNYGYLKSMWSEYYNEDVVEIYGEMLVQCFALLFERSENESPYEEDKICDSCVVKLRDAYMFKKSILESQEKLMNQIEDGDNTVQSDIIVKSEIEDESFIELDNQSGSTKDHNAAVETANIIFQDVEFLEEDNGEPKMAVTGDKRLFVTFETSTQPSTEDKPVKKRQCPKKLPKCEQYKTCKQYTAEDLQECMEAVFAEKLTPKQASVLYKIPKKTIESKLKALKTDGNNSMKSEIILEQSGTEGESFTVLDNQSGRNKQSVDFKCKSKGYNARVETANIIYHDVEFLEEDDHETKMAVTVPVVTSTQPNTEGKPVKKRKWPQKLPKNERYKTYKQYTVDDLRMCLEAVSAEELTPQQASILYKIPKKTIEGKLRASKADTQTDTTTVQMDDPKGKLSRRRPTIFVCNAKKVAEQNKIKRILIYDKSEIVKDEIIANIKPIQIDAEQVRSKYKTIVNAKMKENTTELDKLDASEMDKHRDNIKTILQFSNATMIKGFWGDSYSCCLCSEQRCLPAELKTHNLEVHNNVGNDVIKVKYVSDLVIRLDITGLKCKLCDENFHDLESFTVHLRIVHSKMIHSDIKNYIIPFKFDSDNLKCVVCKKIFQYFKLLSEHMSEHYRNYECSICERAFINKQSMQTHSYRHKSGVFKCSHCPKIFDTRPKKSVHERIVHALSNKTRKCGFCEARFSTKDLVKAHEVKVHGVKPTVFSCQACNKTYNSHSSLVTHRKRFHLMLRPHQCTYCDMAFFSRIELKSHTVTHTKSREFKCEMCSKCFGTRCSLNQHLRGHSDDRKFKCENCARSFVHRTAWKVHMRSKHGKVV